MAPTADNIEESTQSVPAAAQNQPMLHYEGEFRDDNRDGRGVLTQDVE